MRAKQTNQKYDEAEQKSQAWMKAKDEAQSHKRMWHSYWQQAMVEPYALRCLQHSSYVMMLLYTMLIVFMSMDIPFSCAAAFRLGWEITI